MAVAEGIVVFVVTVLFGGLLPAGVELPSMSVAARLRATLVESPREQLRSPIPPGVRPRPARPGITPSFASS